MSGAAESSRGAAASCSSTVTWWPQHMRRCGWLVQGAKLPCPRERAACMRACVHRPGPAIKQQPAVLPGHHSSACTCLAPCAALSPLTYITGWPGAGGSRQCCVEGQAAWRALVPLQPSRRCRLAQLLCAVAGPTHATRPTAGRRDTSRPAPGPRPYPHLRTTRIPTPTQGYPLQPRGGGGWGLAVHGGGWMRVRGACCVCVSGPRAVVVVCSPSGRLRCS